MRFRRSRVPRLFPIASLGILAGLTLAALMASPRVESVSPASGAADVPASAAVEIDFTAAMDAPSVEARFHLDPAVPGSIAWSDDARVMRFQPAGAWPQNVTVTAALGSGARSARGLPALRGAEWSFTVGAPSLAYLSPTDGPANIYRVAVTGDSPVPKAITSAPNGVYDFAIRADGARIVYAALRPDGGADLRAVDVTGQNDTELLGCPGEACLSPAFSPDGTRIAFERHAISPGGEVSFADSSVWLLDLGSGEVERMSDPTHVAGLPEFTPSGALAFLDSDLQAIVLKGLDTRAETYIPNTSGDPGAWSPDGRVFVFPEITFAPEPTSEPTPIPPDPLATPSHEDVGHFTFYSHLLRVTVADNTFGDLSGETFVEDSSPAFSPDGTRIAFARRYLDNARFTPGRQLWVMNPDGSGAHALTDAPGLNHSALTWSPDGESIAFMRFNTGDFAAPASIWLIGADGSGLRLLAENAYLPRWIP